MRPTFSIIAFTVLSGAGYGLWFLLGLAAASGWPACAAPAADACAAHSAWLAGGLGAGFVLVTAGLLCSLGHLGKPLRAWRALSQWRSSWLSREGVASLLTYLPALGLGLPALAGALGAEAAPFPGGRRVAGLALALGAAATVVCTANIYASLKPIRAWRDRGVVPGYLLLGLYSGGLLLWLGAALAGAAAGAMRMLPVGLAILALACAWLKRGYWRRIDALPPANAGRATGLDALGATRTLEQPHTEENYLTREMGFVFARRHARRLRAFVQGAGFAAPALLAAAAAAWPAAGAVAAAPALASALCGLLVERWLFFAEARHAVAGYYAR